MIFKQSCKQKKQKALSFENELDVHKEEEKGWRRCDKHIWESDRHWDQLADDKSPTNIQTEKPPTQSPQCTCNNFHPKICLKLICWMAAKNRWNVKILTYIVQKEKNQLAYSYCLISAIAQRAVSFQSQTIFNNPYSISKEICNDRWKAEKYFNC